LWSQVYNLRKFWRSQSGSRGSRRGAGLHSGRASRWARAPVRTIMYPVDRPEQREAPLGRTSERSAASVNTAVASRRTPHEPCGHLRLSISAAVTRSFLSRETCKKGSCSISLQTDEFIVTADQRRKDQCGGATRECRRLVRGIRRRWERGLAARR